MTVKELYEYAVENNLENLSIVVRTENPYDDFNYCYDYPCEIESYAIGEDNEKSVILCA